jgi:hypothetical protein
VWSFSRVLHQDRARVKQVETSPLHVLLRLGGRLGRHDGKITTGGCCVDQPGREQCSLNTSTPMCGPGRRSGELCETLSDVEACATGDNSVAQRDVAPDPRRNEVAFCPLDDLAREVFIRSHTLSIRMNRTLHNDG